MPYKHPEEPAELVARIAMKLKADPSLAISVQYLAEVCYEPRSTAHEAVDKMLTEFQLPSRLGVLEALIGQAGFQLYDMRVYSNYKETEGTQVIVFSAPPFGYPPKASATPWGGHAVTPKLTASGVVMNDPNYAAQELRAVSRTFRMKAFRTTIIRYMLEMEVAWGSRESV